MLARHHPTSRCLAHSPNGLRRHAAAVPARRGCPSSSAGRLRLCRFQPDSKDGSASDGDSSAAEGASRDPKESRKLINQLLQIQSLSSLQSMRSVDNSQGTLPPAVQPTETHLQQGKMPSALAEQFVNSAAQQAADVTAAAGAPSISEPTSLFDDPAAEDYDPLVLDMLGFTTIAQYLDHKVSSSAAEAKLSMAAVLLWALMATAALAPLGGVSAYTDSIAIFTDGGLQMGNLAYLWVAMMAYYSVKGCVMGLVTSLRAWRLHEQQGQRLEELAQTAQVQEQRRAFWRLQEQLQRADDKANRTYAEFALSSLLLGVLLLMMGGLDHLELQLATLDQEAFLKLLVVLWLFWESYFAVVGGTVKVSNWASAVLQRWQHQRKWGGRARGGRARGKQ